MTGMHERTRILIGDEGLDKLKSARVAVMGLGGVGGVAAEELCRAGIGKLAIADFDVVKVSNLNRQLIALGSTVGRPKTEVAAERLRDINPEIELEIIGEFVGPENLDALDLARFDYILDCIDSLNPKVSLIRAAVQKGVPIIVSTGAGGRIDPTGVMVGDLFKTKNCPLASHLRKRLRRQGIHGPIPAVHIPHPPMMKRGDAPGPGETERGRPRAPIGSIAFVPAVYGCVMASYVVMSILGYASPHYSRTP